MKHLIFTLTLVSLLNSCQFNQSVNKDLITGAYLREDGLSCDGVTIEVSGKADERNEFVYGEKVNVFFNNVSGLNKIDGKSFPEISLYIVKNEKDTIFSNPNLLKLPEGTDLLPLTLNANFIAAYPLGEAYKLHINIADQKSEGKIVYEFPFTIKKNELLEINTKGINYSTAYLWNKTKKMVVTPMSKIDVNDELILILEGVTGFELEDNKAFPVFSIDVESNNGAQVLSNPNLLSSYEVSGVNPIDLKSQLTARIKFTESELSNPYKLNVKLTDNNSEKEITLSGELNIN